MDLGQALTMIEQEMERHDLLVEGAEWSFRFGTKKRAAGTCNYDKREIQLSEGFVRNNTREVVWEVLIHEIAHALCPRGTGHGSLFKATVRALGGTMVTCSSRDIQMPEPEYELYCRCNSYPRHRIKKSMLGRVCRRCAQPLQGRKRILESA